MLLKLHKNRLEGAPSQPLLHLHYPLWHQLHLGDSAGTQRFFRITFWAVTTLKTIDIKAFTCR